MYTTHTPTPHPGKCHRVVSHHQQHIHQGRSSSNRWIFNQEHDELSTAALHLNDMIEAHEEENEQIRRSLEQKEQEVMQKRQQSDQVLREVCSDFLICLIALFSSLKALLRCFPTTLIVLTTAISSTLGLKHMALTQKRISVLLFQI